MNEPSNESTASDFFTYVRLSRPPQTGRAAWRSRYHTTRQPWADFCAAFARSPETLAALPEGDAPLGENRGAWTPYIYPDPRAGSAQFTALILDVGHFAASGKDDVAAILRRAETLPFPYLAYTKSCGPTRGETLAEIRLVVPLAEPTTRITQTSCAPICRYLRAVFDSEWAESTYNMDNVVFYLPIWDADAKTDKWTGAAKGNFACAFRADGPLPTFDALLGMIPKSR